MESARTILELKSAFIRRQLRILSENIEPNENWRDYAVRSDEEDLSEKVVEDVLQKCMNLYSFVYVIARKLTALKKRS